MTNEEAARKAYEVDRNLSHAATRHGGAWFGEAHRVVNDALEAMAWYREQTAQLQERADTLAWRCVVSMLGVPCCMACNAVGDDRGLLHSPECPAWLQLKGRPR